MRRILVTGAGGQLAADLRHVCRDDDVTWATRTDLDLTDPSVVATAVRALRPDAIINAAAWTDVDGCETDPARAQAVNADGPGHLARAATAVGARLVHVSTDYVFGGDAPAGADGRPRGWREDDPVAPASVYGRTKAEGEAQVAAADGGHLSVRTAWLAGAGGGNFVRTMLRLAGERDRIAVVDDQVGSPTFTADLAVALRWLATAELPGTATGGADAVLHVVNGGRASWYDLAAETFALSGAQVQLDRQPSSALDRPAPRPPWSVLDTARAADLGLPPLPAWPDGLRRLLAELGALRA